MAWLVVGILLVWDTLPYIMVVTLVIVINVILQYNDHKSDQEPKKD